MDPVTTVLVLIMAVAVFALMAAKIGIGNRVAIDLEQPCPRARADGLAVALERVGIELGGEGPATDAADPPQAEGDGLEGARRLVEDLTGLRRKGAFGDRRQVPIQIARIPRTA